MRAIHSEPTENGITGSMLTLSPVLFLGPTRNPVTDWSGTLMYWEKGFSASFASCCAVVDGGAVGAGVCSSPCTVVASIAAGKKAATVSRYRHDTFTPGRSAEARRERAARVWQRALRAACRRRGRR